MKWLLVLMVAVVYALHHDIWFWKDRSLVFGFLPVGLAYHGGFAILSSGMLAVLVKFAWPDHLEESVADLPNTPREDLH